MEANVLCLGLTCLVGAYAFVFGFLRKVNEWFYVGRLGEMRHHLPPGDMGWPVVGKTLSYMRAFRSKDPDSFMSSFVTRYGDRGVYRTLMFGKPSIMVCMPDACRRILADENNFKLSYPETTQELIGRGSFHSMSIEEHKHFRRMTAPVINGSETLSKYIKRTEEIMVGFLEEWAKMDHPVEFFAEMKKAAYKVILPIFLGSEDDAFIGRTMKLFANVNDGFNSMAINIPGFTYHRARKSKRELDKILKEVIDARKSMESKNSSSVSQSMIDLLLKAEYEDGRAIDVAAVRDILHTYLLAGYESTARAAMWMMVYLHEHPDIFLKAKEEQIQILQRREPMQTGLSYEEIKQMQYLSKVTDEMLRRVSIGFALFREAKADATINGYVIPKGWKVLVCLRAMHLDPKYYADPKEFDPSRWDNIRNKGGAFMPFGGGSRFCQGSDLAKLEIFIFFHHFLLNYEVKRINPGCSITYLPAPSPSDNLLVKFKRLH